MGRVFWPAVVAAAVFLMLIAVLPVNLTVIKNHFFRWKRKSRSKYILGSVWLASRIQWDGLSCGGRILPQVQNIRGWFLCRRGHQAVDFFVGDTRVFNILLRLQLLVALAPGQFQDTVAIVGIREARSLATTQPQIGLAFRWVRNTCPVDL